MNDQTLNAAALHFGLNPESVRRFVAVGGKMPLPDEAVAMGGIDPWALRQKRNVARIGGTVETAVSR